MLHAMMMMILITLIYCHFHYSSQDFKSSLCCYFEFVPFCSYFL